MAKPGTVTGWKLPVDEREQLLRQFEPKYENVIADHVTLRVGATPATPMPRKPEARIVGHADDGKSLECLVVGSTERPTGPMARPITSPGHWGPAARRARATTCCATRVGSIFPRRSA